jgi:hypothetical protein
MKGIELFKKLEPIEFENHEQTIKKKLMLEMNSSLLYNFKKGVATKKRSIYIKFIMLKNANVS